MDYGEMSGECRERDDGANGKSNCWWLRMAGEDGRKGIWQGSSVKLDGVEGDMVG